MSVPNNVVSNVETTPRRGLYPLTVSLVQRKGRVFLRNSPMRLHRHIPCLGLQSCHTWTWGIVDKCGTMATRPVVVRCRSLVIVRQSSRDTHTASSLLPHLMMLRLINFRSWSCLISETISDIVRDPSGRRSVGEVEPGPPSRCLRISETREGEILPSASDEEGGSTISTPSRHSLNSSSNSMASLK